MRDKIEKTIEHIENSNKLSKETKKEVLQKLHEWKNEKNIINDVAIRFENYWLEIEPLFAEMGWV